MQDADESIRRSPAADERVPVRADGRAAMFDQVVAEVVAQLQRHRAGPIDAVHIRRLVEVEWDRYDGARVRTFVPVLVRRAVIGRVLGAG